MARTRFVVGLVGGVASGKSTVASLFRKMGARTIDADELSHQAVERPEVRDEIVRTWGPEVLSQGRIDRKALAERAFRTPEDVAKLNAIVHPAVAQELVRRVQEAVGVVVVEAALLLETGAKGLCDAVVHVEVSTEERRRRAALRGWSPEELDRRERFQWPAAKKRAHADYVVSNESDLGATEEQVRKLFEGFRRELGD